MVGASPMNERCATSLAAEGFGFVIANRTQSKAADFVSHFTACNPGLEARAIGLDELAADPPAVEVVLCATAASEPVVDAALLGQLADRVPSGQTPLVVDFAVPPDVDPAACARLGIERISMQDIIDAAEATRERRLAEAAEAREEIDVALERLRLRLGDEHVAPFVSALQRRYRAIAKQGAEHLLDKRLSSLDDAGRAAVFSFAEKLAGRFAHLPSTGLFGVARVGGPAAVDAFLARADKELAKEFERAASEAHHHSRTDSPS
jgi:glutamyl-tRNA reductase